MAVSLTAQSQMMQISLLLTSMHVCSCVQQSSENQCLHFLLHLCWHGFKCLCTPVPTLHLYLMMCCLYRNPHKPTYILPSSSCTLCTTSGPSPLGASHVTYKVVYAFSSFCQLSCLQLLRSHPTSQLQHPLQPSPATTTTLNHPHHHSSSCWSVDHLFRSVSLANQPAASTAGGLRTVQHLGLACVANFMQSRATIIRL